MLSANEFNQLRAFIAVGEALSFSRAAEQLGVSPSALSQVIRGLEERIGMRLLNRTTRSVSLTSGGEALLMRVRVAVVDLDNAVNQAKLVQTQVAGPVRIHSFRRGAELYLTPILAAFAHEYPDIVLDITADDAVVDMVADGYDAAIRIGEVIERDMITFRLGPDFRQVVVGSPDYLSRHGIPLTPRDLRDHSCIRWRWDGTTRPQNWEFCENGRAFSVVVDGPLILNSRDLETLAALSGVGLACTVEARVNSYISEGRLVPVLQNWSRDFAGYFLCYPNRQGMAPATRAFIDYLKSYALKEGFGKPDGLLFSTDQI